MRSFFFVLLLLLCCRSGLAQETPAAKQLPAKRTTAAIKIDGQIDEAAWKEAVPASGFIEWRPNPGKPEDTANRTLVYLLYDNTSIYIGGYCYERTKDSISKELVGRDVVGVNDFVGVIFDTYYDKINATGFYVTPLGEQFDAKYSSDNGEDGSWNAVWDSEARLHADGWSFEMRIPYSALRFSSAASQRWGLNITRRRNKTGQQYMWNPIDPKINGFVNQEGSWTGIEKIEAPVRLSLSPYLSAYANHYPEGKKDWSNSINGGMDVKYGISQGFTLDMTLVPDFGQVQSDNLVLNLSPFEVKYNENRPFFTEGTELFSKGNLFYSRRIGSTPMHFWDVDNQLAAGERVVKNPSESRLINATKVSGRTRKGLGIGFFNALTKPMYAEVENSDGALRKIRTAPLTNYNIMVLDQTLKNNSSVSFINTSVLRNGADYDANVSAALFNFNNKKNTYNWNGKFALSQLSNPAGKHDVGYSHYVGFNKSGGRLLFSLTQELADHRYQINDMGILYNNNYLDHYFWTGYRWLKPGKWYNRIQLNFNATYSRRYLPADYQGFFTNVNGNVQLKSLWWMGAFMGLNAAGNNFYEPRMEGKVYRSPRSWRFAGWVETNSAKKYYAGLDVFTAFTPQFNGSMVEARVWHRYRFSDKFSLSQDLYLNPSWNDAGFYDLFYETVNGSSTFRNVLFSIRDRNTVENVLKAKYNFNNKSGITFRARHYWSEVDPRKLFDLQTDGSLLPTVHAGMAIRQQNINFFNIDAVYTLQFAPGSFLNIVWKNAIQRFDEQVQYRYFKNIDRTMDTPQNNNLSVKVLYYLDYLDFKKWRRKKA